MLYVYSSNSWEKFCEKKGIINVEENIQKESLIKTISSGQLKYVIDISKARKIIFVPNKIINFVL